MRMRIRRRDYREWESILNSAQPYVTEEMNSHFSSPINLAEIKMVIFQMGSLQASSHDGFDEVFFHSYWDVIQGEVNAMVRAFANGDDSLRKLNSTHIFFIPKVTNSILMGQFRLISLCNYSYKTYRIS
ncbi:hypothetical protein FF1_012194 [Malus domestica]